MPATTGVEWRLSRTAVRDRAMIFNLPTALTWLRIVLIPVFVGVFYLPASWLSMPGKNWLAMTVFALAAITDWADGYLARKWGQTSAFGAFLDPVADKLMVVSALIVLVWLDRADAFLAIVIIGREIAISALRESPFRAAIANANVPNMLGQISTTMANAGLNIHNMVNKSRGEMAYTLVDVDSPIKDAVIRDLSGIEGVLSVRSIPASDDAS